MVLNCLKQGAYENISESNPQRSTEAKIFTDIFVHGLKLFFFFVFFFVEHILRQTDCMSDEISLHNFALN